MQILKKKFESHKKFAIIFIPFFAIRDTIKKKKFVCDICWCTGTVCMLSGSYSRTNFFFALASPETKTPIRLDVVVSRRLRNLMSFYLPIEMRGFYIEERPWPTVP